MSLMPQSGESLGPYLRRVLSGMVTSVKTTGNVTAQINGNTLSISVPNVVQAKPFFAKITGSSGAAYAWTEQWQTNATTFADLPNGRSGTTTANSAYEINGRQGIPNDTIIILFPVMPSDNGPTIYQFDRAEGTETTPFELGTPGDSSETADTDVWDREAQGTDTGVEVPVVTRSVYDAAGDEILYQFIRVMTFDSSGRLTLVSAETRYTIDTPDEDCTVEE